MVSGGPVAVLAVGFFLGAALMGVEMAGIRLITPYFGSSIEIWACMISTVMLALMSGYFIGGIVADKFPNSSVLGGFCVLAAILLIALPMVSDWVLEHLVDALGFEPMVALLAALLLLFLPLTLMSVFSPFAVRLIITDTANSGKVAGSVYAITTIGNVVGTLAVPLVLMGFLGSREIIYILAGLVLTCGFVLIFLHAPARASLKGAVGLKSQ